ncbi:MAG: hypothetical protein IT439_12025 [Phycisphaerales bacterium]|nr:hypothetical protein [Phycisphaerales bacterium]
MRASRWVGWLGMLCCWCAGARAQFLGGGGSKDAPTISLRPAFDTPGGRVTPTVPCDRWLPFVVEVGPGDGGGIISISYRQDATQRTTILTPFAATPGRTVRLPVYLSLPAYVDEIDVSMQGRTSAGKGFSVRETLGGFGGDGSGRFVPLMTGTSASLVLWCGRTSLAEASLVDPRRTGRSAGATFGSLEPDALPLTPMGYDACAGLVIRPGALRGAGEPAKRAVREWVAAGGRLVLVCEDAGSDWMSWVPEGVAQRLVDLAEPQGVDLGGMLSSAPLRDRSLPARPVRLLPEGEASGWRVDWLSGGTALAASGPAGLGIVTILGADPTSLLDPRDEERRADGLDRLWVDALAEGVGDVETGGSLDEPGMRGSIGLRYLGVSSGANDAERNAVASTLDGLAQAPALGRGVFWGIGLSMLALVLLLGPVDYFVLKRLGLRHRSWITALGWIGIASGAAMIVPGAMRSGNSQLTSTRFTDVLIDGTQRQGWSTGYLGIFSGAPMNPRFTQGPEDGWWRGVSGLSDRGQRAALKPLMLLQSGASCEPVPGDRVSPMPMGLWMFRTVMEQSRPAETPSVRVSRAIDEWDVTIEGLPEDVRSVSINVHWSDAEATGRIAPAAGGKASLTIEAGGRSQTPGGGVLDSPGPGTGLRTDAMRRRVRTGRWALVELTYETENGPYGLSERVTTRHREVVRALVRLADDEGASQ